MIGGHVGAVLVEIVANAPTMVGMPERTKTPPPRAATPSVRRTMVAPERDTGDHRKALHKPDRQDTSAARNWWHRDNVVFQTIDPQQDRATDDRRSTPLGVEQGWPPSAAPSLHRGQKRHQHADANRLSSGLRTCRARSANLKIDRQNGENRRVGSGCKTLPESISPSRSVLPAADSRSRNQQKR